LRNEQNLHAHSAPELEGAPPPEGRSGGPCSPARIGANWSYNEGSCGAAAPLPPLLAAAPPFAGRGAWHMTQVTWSLGLRYVQ